MPNGFKWRGQRSGVEMNKGQMVSSTGLCSTLQRKNPAEFDEHNFDCKSELSEFRIIVAILSPSAGPDVDLHPLYLMALKPLV